MFDRENDLYLEDILNIQPYIKKLCEKPETRILLTGATGMIGVVLVDAVVYFNKQHDKQKVMLSIITRDARTAKARLGKDFEEVKCFEQNVIDSLPEDDFDYIIHLASNANPAMYEKYPFETIETNVLGAVHIERYLRTHKETKAVVASSMEVYGELDINGICEHDYGRIDFNILRAGYPESKRVMELIFKSSVKEYGTKSVIARLGYVYGPTMLDNDNKVICEFIRCAKYQKDIKLKTQGEQIRSYCYVADVASALLLLLEKGTSGRVYNVADRHSVVSIKELAEQASVIGGVKLECGHEKVTRTNNDVILNIDLIEDLGWMPKVSIIIGLKKSIELYQEI